MTAKKLPEWASVNKQDGFIEVDPDVVYPKVLTEFKDLLGDEPRLAMLTETTQWTLEIARKTFTRDLLLITGPGLNLRILKNEDWKLANFPAGERPPLEFRTFYNGFCKLRAKTAAGTVH